MTTTWSFWFFILMTSIAFMLAPFILGICIVLIVLVIIGNICRRNIERRRRHVQRDPAQVVRRGHHPV